MNIVLGRGTRLAVGGGAWYHLDCHGNGMPRCSAWDEAINDLGILDGWHLNRVVAIDVRYCWSIEVLAVRISAVLASHQRPVRPPITSDQHSASSWDAACWSLVR